MLLSASYLLLKFLGYFLLVPFLISLCSFKGDFLCSIFQLINSLLSYISSPIYLDFFETGYIVIYFWIFKCLPHCLFLLQNLTAIIDPHYLQLPWGKFFPLLHIVSHWQWNSSYSVTASFQVWPRFGCSLCSGFAVAT